MRVQDQVVLALCIWRENRGGGTPGMQSVANVIANRAAKSGDTVWREILKPWQFASMTAKGDPELNLWPNDGDPQWDEALRLAALADNALPDITNGATLYYAPHSIESDKTFRWLDGSVIPFPRTWNPAAVTPLCKIGGQVFFK